MKGTGFYRFGIKKCGESAISISTPITNADRIRSMSDEELAKFLHEIERRRSATGGGAKWSDAQDTLCWLREPAKE